MCLLSSSPCYYFRLDEMELDIYSEFDPTMLSSQGPGAYQKLLDKDLQLRRNSKHGSLLKNLAYLDSKEFQSKNDFNWIKQSIESEPLHSILALHEDRNPIRGKSNKSRNHSKQISRPKIGSMLNKYYARHMAKMTKKSLIKKTVHHKDYSSLLYCLA